MESQALKSNTLYCVLLPTVRECTMDLFSFRLLYISNRVSIRKTFAQFLRNETQNFSFFAHQFCAKKQQFAQSFAKVISCKIALYLFCETQVLCNSATRVLRNSAICKNQTVGDGVCFLEFNSSSARYQNPKQIVQ